MSTTPDKAPLPEIEARDALEVFASDSNLVRDLCRYFHTANQGMEIRIERAAKLADAAIAALSRPAPAAEVTGERKIRLLLAMMDSAGGHIDATDDKHSLLNYFCGDVEPTDTFNQAIDRKLIRTTHHDIAETSTAYLTDEGRALLATPSPRCRAGAGGSAYPNN